MKTIAIIGGGAAGLMAAITAAEAGAAVTVFEQNDAPGKKILASGNGRCNIINRESGIGDYEGETPAFAAGALAAMPFKQFERFCRRIGLLLECKADGKCYPLSHEARSVQTALTRAALRLKVMFRNNTPVANVAKAGSRFIVETADGPYEFDRLIIATGSPAAPQLGGSDSGMHFAAAFGHAVIAPFPSLVGLHLDEARPEQMTGVKTTARVSLSVDGAPAKEEEGDILFTRYGLSGFAVLDLSHTASKALRDFARVTLAVDLLPRITRQALAAQIEQMAKLIPEDTLYDLLCGLLPQKLVRPLLLRHKLSPEMRGADLNAKTAKKVAYALKQWPFTVTDTHGYQHAEVAGGGISTEEIDPETMASKKVPGLYFAGEVIDVTGRRGGFNFHFAWGSGNLAGANAAR